MQWLIMTRRWMPSFAIRTSPTSTILSPCPRSDISLALASSPLILQPWSSPLPATPLLDYFFFFAPSTADSSLQASSPPICSSPRIFSHKECLSHIASIFPHSSLSHFFQSRSFSPTPPLNNLSTYIGIHVTFSVAATQRIILTFTIYLNIT